MGKDSKPQAKGGKGGGDKAAKGGDKGGKGAAKGGKGGGKEEEKGGGSSMVSVRHILCEKESKCLEALAKLQVTSTWSTENDQWLQGLEPVIKVCKCACRQERSLTRWPRCSARTRRDKEATWAGRPGGRWSGLSRCVLATSL